MVTGKNYNFYYIKSSKKIAQKATTHFHIKFIEDSLIKIKFPPFGDINDLTLIIKTFFR